MKKILILIPLIGWFLGSCDKVEHPYPVNTSELDTNIYVGNWSDYVASEWPTFTANINTNRNILIEDFTGHKCIYCPAAATVAENIKDANPGRVYIASIHTSPTGIGSFQELHEPLYTHDFTNSQGLEIGTYFGTLPGSTFVGNPWGAVSRILTSGQNTIGPANWESTANSILSANDLKVNLQAKLNYYDQTKGFYLHTEIEKFPSVTNDLAQVVYLIEDSIVKPQSFPGKDSINYVHHNVHRACIDGKAFGRTLKDSDKDTNGKYYVNYSFKIPSQYNPDNLHVLIYVFDKVTYEIYQVIRVNVN